MRIVMLAPPPGVRGPLLRTASMLAEPMRAHGHAVAILPWGRHHEDEAVRDKLAGRARDIIRLRRILAHEPYDVLLVHTSHDWAAVLRDLALVFALRSRRRPIVLQFHGSEPEQLLRPGNTAFKAATRALLGSVDAVLVCSSEERARWRTFAPYRACHAVDYPFLPVGRAEHAGDETEAAGGVPTLLFAGRLIREKGILDAIAAMPLVLREASCRLMVAGDGPVAAEARARAEALGLDGRVVFAGHLGADELGEAYRTAAALVLPTYHPEGFPNVIGEAMHAGLPIITTRIRGAADHLRDGEHALFVPAHDPAAVAAAALRLLRDPALRAAMAAANREKVKDFAPDAVARRYLEVLANVARDA